MHWADVAVQALAGAAIKSLVLLGAAAALLAVWRSARPRERARLWTVVLVGSLLVPLLGRLLPQLEVAVLPSVRSTAVAGSGTPLEAVSPAPGTPPGAVETTQAWADGQPWTVWVILAWAAGAAAVTVRQLAGLLAVRSLSREAHATHLPFPIEPLAAAFGIRRRLRLRQSDAISSPLTWGWLRPQVLLPARATEWQAERLRATLEHELAHVARWDWLARTVGWVACAVYWFNPLAWVALRRQAAEQELACDRAVLARGCPASDYASHLLATAQEARTAVAGSPAMSGAGGLEERVMAVLQPLANHGKARASAAVPVIVMLALIPALAVMSPWVATAAQEQPLPEGSQASDARKLEEGLAAMDKIFEGEQGVLAGQPSAYSAAEGRDPFVDQRAPEPSAGSQCSGTGLAATRVEELVLEGTVSLPGGATVALVRGPDHLGYLLNAGGRLCDGEAVSVSDHKLVIRQRSDGPRDALPFHDVVLQLSE